MLRSDQQLTYQRKSGVKRPASEICGSHNSDPDIKEDQDLKFLGKLISFYLSKMDNNNNHLKKYIQN